MPLAYLGVGSNLGDPIKNILRALEILNAHESIRSVRKSPLYKNSAWGKTDQPDFVNGCLEVETNLSPQELLEVCLQTEKQMGRERNEKWGPRIIDIDVLLFEDVVLKSETLKIPHPYIEQRVFVLKPLLDLNLKLKHPQSGLPFSDALDQMKNELAGMTQVSLSKF